MRTAYDRIGGLERILDQAKSVRNRAKDLKSQAEIKDDASRLLDDAERLVENVDKLMEKTQSDFKSLDNVKQGTIAPVGPTASSSSRTAARSSSSSRARTPRARLATRRPATSTT